VSRRRFLGGAAALGTSAMLPGCEAGGREVLRWGSSSLGSSGYVIMEALAQSVNARSPLRNSSLATLGAAENLALIASGDIEFGHTTSVEMVIAQAGQRPYRRPIDFQQMFAYATWHMPPLVRGDGPVRTLADLPGRRYAPSTHGSGAAILHHALMRAAGIDDRLRWTYGSWTDAYDAFKTGRLDVVVGVLTNGRLSTNIMEAQAVTAVRPLEIPADVLGRARQENGGIFAAAIDPAAWPGLEGPVLAPLTVGILAVSPRVTAEQGYEVTRAIFDHADEVRRLGLLLDKVEPEFAVRNMMAQFPVHAGAARYFRERGLWDARLRAAQAG